MESMEPLKPIRPNPSPSLALYPSRTLVDYFSCNFFFCSPFVRSSNFIFWLCACQHHKEEKYVRYAGVAWRRPYWINQRMEKRWRRRCRKYALSMYWLHRSTCLQPFSYICVLPPVQALAAARRVHLIAAVRTWKIVYVSLASPVAWRSIKDALSFYRKCIRKHGVAMQW